MKFLLDESADFPLAAYLEQLGHDVTAVVHDYTLSIKDHEVLSIANAEQRIVITNDKDFGELIYHRKLSHSGVIFLRLGDESIPRKIDRLDDVLTHHADDLSDRSYVTVTDKRIRVP